MARKKSALAEETTERKSTPRSTKAEVILRVSEVRGWLLIGYSRGEIIQNVQDKWGVGEDQTDHYIARATSEIEEWRKPDRDNAVQHVLRRLLKLAEETSGPDKRLFLDTMKEVSKLLGLYEVQPLYLELSPDTLAMMDQLGVSKKELNVAIARILEKKIGDQPMVQ